ncbi:hypothetical protein CWO27_11550 [Vibrio sp. 10N.286.51.C3]|uniref:FAD-binding protein n=1 Tax=unclassified Vibrio TaxID=2614977 RepID=UPI000D3846EE|nr:MULTISPECIES: FAD-binding protein [unclassified Vibrio]PTP14238.1 hypothetical protein CWO27_11550 [Vibrio sp. 10N.286.51.C3]TKE67237.1 FAD-binding protein [Vibrio sp. F12]
MIKKHFNLINHNTFKTSTICQDFFEYREVDELIEFHSKGGLDSREYLILGSGSNILFKSDFQGIILHPKKSSIEITDLNDGTVHLKAYAGLSWDKLVEKSLEQGFVGLENLSLIPGSVGASPVQNIGAYGVEVSNLIYEVECYDLDNKMFVTLNNRQCEFSYRDSIFKVKTSHVVISVTYKLYKSNFLKYEEDNNKKVSPLTYFKELFLFSKVCLKSVSIGSNTKWKLKLHFDYLRNLLSSFILPAKFKRKIVVFIRTRAMPDPVIKPNVGCFFKSPIITNQQFDILKKKNSKITTFYYNEGFVKVSAGDLIRDCINEDDYISAVCVDRRRPIILINNKLVDGSEIFSYSQDLINRVEEKYNIKIEPEVVII